MFWQGVEALSASSAYQKCHQIANGCIYKADTDIIQPGYSPKNRKRKWHIVHEKKLDALEDLIEELNGKPLLVAYFFRHDLDQLKKRFKNMQVLGSSMKECQRLERKWNKGDIQLFIFLYILIFYLFILIILNN